MTAIASGDLADELVPGERIRIAGRVIDGAGAPIPDAMIEIWQADSEGRYAHPADGRASNQNFRGFGRFGTGTDPREPLRLSAPSSPARSTATQAPHINVIVFMRGMLTHAYTRLYFSDEAEANARDPVLAERAGRAARDADRTPRATMPAPCVYRFDIRMQGDDETVFFDV